MYGVMKQFWAVSCERPQRWEERLSILAGLNTADTNTIADHGPALGPVAGELLVVPTAESAVAGDTFVSRSHLAFKLEIQT